MKSKSDKLSVKGLSKAFGVSQVTVRNWIDKGVPCKRTPKGYTFDLTEAIRWREKYLQESKQGNDEFEAARTEKEIYRAKTARLRYEKEAGELIPVADVKKISFESARMTRDAILNVPARLSPILAAERDSKKVHDLLMGELRQCLENLANQYCDGTIIQKLLNEKESEGSNESSQK